MTTKDVGGYFIIYYCILIAFSLFPDWAKTGRRSQPSLWADSDHQRHTWCYLEGRVIYLFYIYFFQGMFLWCDN